MSYQQHPEQYNYRTINGLIDEDKVASYVDPHKDYADLGSAFTQSPTMQDFQAKMKLHNPLFPQDDSMPQLNLDLDDDDKINDQNDKINDHNDKINDQIKNLIQGTHRGNSTSDNYNKSYPQSYNDNLLENYPNTFLEPMPSCDLVGAVLMVVVIAAIIYGGVYVYKKYSSKQ